jgi:O-methyltransferase
MTLLPWRVRYALRCLGQGRDVQSALRFVLRNDLAVSRRARLAFVRDIYRISYRVWCAHTQEEMIEVATAVLKVPPEREGIIVEAGCYKGGSTAKLSLIARLTGRKLVAFDSFEGLPDNDESGQQSMFGETADFSRGVYRGVYEEVEANIKRFGHWPSCRLVKGWFDETMPHHAEPIVVAFIDVDLVTSTKTCLRFLFPHVQPGGSIFSQDGHLPKIVELLDDDRFWREEVGRDKPRMVGLRQAKLVEIVNQAG